MLHLTIDGTSTLVLAALLLPHGRRTDPPTLLTTEGMYGLDA
ncbi:MAG TPA: hypothetical protein VGD69_29940 [Herpetosiphonaceae bacterium]